MFLYVYKKHKAYSFFFKITDNGHKLIIALNKIVLFLSKAPSFFLKRKFMNVSNAKNFLCGSLAKQADYFDELEDIIYFQKHLSHEILHIPHFFI